MKNIFLFGIILMLGAGCVKGEVREPASDPEPQVELQSEAVEEVAPEDIDESTPMFLDIGDGEDPESAWLHLHLSATVQDCHTFRSFLTDRSQATDEDCEEVHQLIATDPPMIDWATLVYNENRDQAKVSLQNGRTLTTFVLGSDGIWRADTKFWK